MRVAAVVPNWNGAHLLRQFLPSIAKQTRAFDSVYVVDNGSRDESVTVAKDFGATVIEFQSNRGFAPAVNAGVAAAEADAVAILNNDVELDRGWLEAGIGPLSDPSVSFVTGKLLSAADPKILDGAFDALCRGGCALRCGAGQSDGPFWSVARVVSFAPFTALLLRTSAFRALGGLAAEFESYLEDVEFGLRCASNGYTGRYEPAAVAYHLGSATLGRWNPRTVRNISRNQILLVARHYDRSLIWRFGWSIAVAQLLWGALAFRHGAATAWVVGKIEGLLRFRSSRMAGDPRIADVLSNSERLIYQVQTQTGFDSYWRLYFALTGGAVKD